VTPEGMSERSLGSEYMADFQCGFVFGWWGWAQPLNGIIMGGGARGLTNHSKVCVSWVGAVWLRGH